MRPSSGRASGRRASGSRAAAVWQPPGWSPQGAVDFLHGLTDGAGPCLAAWARGEPDPSWAEWLRGLGLAALAYDRVRAAGLLPELPGELRERLRGAYYAAVADAELHTQELAAVLGALAQGRRGRSGVQRRQPGASRLSRSGLPADGGPGPVGHRGGDALAREVLAGLGYVERGKAERPLALQAGRDGEVQMVGTAAGSGLVELHWGLFAGEWLQRTAAVDSAGIRSRAIPVTLAGHAARTLAAEDAIVHLAVHLAVNHQMAYPGLRGLVDISLLARPDGVQPQSVDWRAVVVRARAWRVAVATWLALSLAAELLGLPGAERAVAALRPSAARRRLLRRFVDGQAVLEGRDMTGGPRRFAYQLLLVDRPVDALRLLGRALWPEGSWLAARYGAAGLRVRMRHVAAALRGRV